MLGAALFFSIIYLLLLNRYTEKGKEYSKIVYLFAFLGTFFGPFLGVILSMNSIRYTHSGIAQTLLSLTPITIIPFSIFVFKERIGIRSIIGTLIALAGVIILIWLK